MYFDPGRDLEHFQFYICFIQVLMLRFILIQLHASPVQSFCAGS